MTAARISRWARRCLLVSAGFLFLAQCALLVDSPRGVIVTLGLYGFVLTTVFGKAYSLVPTYFDRDLAWSRAPQVQLPLTTVGVLAMAGAHWRSGTEILLHAGRLLWVAGVTVFLGTIIVSLRGNLTGSETATGEANAERQPLDRFANAFVPLALAYLAVGIYELAATATPFPTLLDGLGIRISHLLGPGFALLLLFAVGYRLLPRFLSTTPPRMLAVAVLPAGATAPALLAAGYPTGVAFRLGAVLETIAVVGFAGTMVLLVRRSDRDRIGFYGPLIGTLLGCGGVALGAYFAFVGLAGALATVHLQLNTFGLLGLSIVGVVYQFYPPAVADWRGATNRTALFSIGCLALGIVAASLAPATNVPIGTLGHIVSTGGAALFCYVLTATIISQT